MSATEEPSDSAPDFTTKAKIYSVGFISEWNGQKYGSVYGQRIVITVEIPPFPPHDISQCRKFEEPVIEKVPNNVKASEEKVCQFQPNCVSWRVY